MERSFAQLLKLYEAGELTGPELDRFFHLLDDEPNRQLLELAIDQKAAGEQVAGRENEMLTERALQGLMAAIRSDDVESAEPRQVRISSSRYRRKIWWAAASVIVIVSAGIYLWFVSIRYEPTVNINAQSDEILPGRNGAILTLSDGSTVLLDSTKKGAIASPDGASIQLNDGSISYGQSQSATAPTAYNTMTTPKGRTFRITLPDGTRAWLNAASSITYPTRFTENERLIRTTGEVYFEVAKNTSQPFIVQTPTDQITVLGTKFNVNAYEDEAAVKTSLLEGAVKVDGKILKPGETYSNGAVSTEDIQQDIAWVNGFFSFQEAALQTVMRQLARWYDVEVKYQGAIPQRTFNGRIGRNLTLSQVLEILKSMRINYTINKNTLIILPSS